MSYKPSPIISRNAAPLKTLTVTMTVMCYLACLAIGALILVDRAVNAWTSGLESEMTVQVKELSTANIEEELAKAAAILKNTPGVDSWNIMSRSDAAALLEPWLGSVNALDELPIPRLITIHINPLSPPDLAALNSRLTASVAGVVLDSHQHWQAELTRMASVLQRLAALVLLLIGLSAIAIVIFATRSVLDSNRSIVEVLQLVGARDGFIARQIEGRFLRTGLASGLLGVGLGLLTFLAMGLIGPAGGVAEAARSLLYAPGADALLSYAALVSVPIVAVVIGLATSRLTLMRMLRATS